MTNDYFDYNPFERGLQNPLLQAVGFQDSSFKIQAQPPETRNMKLENTLGGHLVIWSFGQNRFPTVKIRHYI